MTEKQERDLRRLRRYVQEQQLVSVMNDTKWCELRNAMLSLARTPKYRLQCLLSPPADLGNWDGDWYYHLPTFAWIEWLDIDPIHRKNRGYLVEDERTDLTADLVALLEQHSIPFEANGSYLRIYGYRRPAG